MDKEDVVCVYISVCVLRYTQTHNVTLLSYKKKCEIMPFAATWMDIEIIILSEVRQTNTI